MCSTYVRLGYMNNSHGTPSPANATASNVGGLYDRLPEYANRAFAAAFYKGLNALEKAALIEHVSAEGDCTYHDARVFLDSKFGSAEAR